MVNAATTRAAEGPGRLTGTLCRAVTQAEKRRAEGRGRPGPRCARRPDRSVWLSLLLAIGTRHLSRARPV